MLIVMRSDCTEDDIRKVLERIELLGLRGHPMPGANRTAIGITGNRESLDPAEFENLPGVSEAIRVTKPYKLVSREVRTDDTIITVGDCRIGGGNFTLIAGPCAVESEEAVLELARLLRVSGAHLFRGGAFKPRTSPYSFQGLREEGLRILAKAREETGLPIVTEAMDVESIELVERYADVIQIGARNMQNFSLLKKAGKTRKPVLLKRGLSATLEDWLFSAEYIMSEGNYEVILCERGIRTFSTHSRNTLDLSVIPAVKKISHLPVIVDPSHATGSREKVLPMARASLAAGADGVMVEVHQDPSRAVSDGPQSMLPSEFEYLVRDLRSIFRVLHPEGKDGYSSS